MLKFNLTVLLNVAFDCSMNVFTLCLSPCLYIQETLWWIGRKLSKITNKKIILSLVSELSFNVPESNLL